MSCKDDSALLPCSPSAFAVNLRCGTDDLEVRFGVAGLKELFPSLLLAVEAGSVGFLLGRGGGPAFADLGGGVGALLLGLGEARLLAVGDDGGDGAGGLGGIDGGRWSGLRRNSYFFTVVFSGISLCFFEQINLSIV